MTVSSHSLCLLALATLAPLAACDDPDIRPADWEVIHAAIIVPSCATASCHSSLSKTAGVDLEDADDAFEFLREQESFVIAGEPESSPIVYLLEGEDRPLMPPDGPLPKADVDWIKQWIEEGALR